MSRSRAVLLAWAAVSCWSGALYLRAAIDPPAGRVFAGTFHWIDDVYNYASYAQQAEDGRFLFYNKLADPATARPQLVNLEWWFVGRLSLAIGRRPLLAFRLMGLLATLGLVAAAERWLAVLGTPPTLRLASLGLVLFGGGLGGLVFELTALPVHRSLDLAVASFPFLETLANPHFTLGTALLAWALWLFTAARGPAAPWLGVLLGSILGLSRPYDCALLVVARGLAVLKGEAPGRWAASLAPLLGLLPVLAYDLWVFFGPDQFRSFQRGASFPPWIDFVPAYGPALALVVLALRQPATAPEERKARAQLLLWLVAALGLAIVGAGSFGLQFLVGVGLPLLLLGAAGLRRLAPAAFLLTTLCFCTSAVVATRIALADDPNWFVPRARLATAAALRSFCSPSDRVLAPPDIGLYAIGLSACHAFVAHAAAPDHGRRLGEVASFYREMSPEQRRLLLDQHHITHLVLPGTPGMAAVGWLGANSPFRAVAIVGQGAITIYSRQPEASGVPGVGSIMLSP